MIRKIVFGLCAGFWLAGGALAQDFDPATLQAQAEAGDASAQFMMGQMTAEDITGAHYIGNSLRWYRRAAEQNYAPAQYELGNALIGLTNVTYYYPDAEEGLIWLKKAASQKFAMAEYRLGQLYGHDENELQIEILPRDDIEAVHWYQLAAEHGSGEAMVALALRARDGRGMAADPEEAVRWARQVVTGKFSDGLDIRAAKDAYTLLGTALMEGKGTAQDYVEARHWLSEAAEQGSAEAQYRLGQLYSQGLGGPKDEAAGAALIQKAADGGYPSDQTDVTEDAQSDLQTMWAQSDLALRSVMKERSDMVRATD